MQVVFVLDARIVGVLTSDNLCLLSFLLVEVFTPKPTLQ